MTDAVMKYALAPVGGFFSGFNSFFLSVGKARAVVAPFPFSVAYYIDIYYNIVC